MKTWLADAIIYEIYPTSFYCGNGDGTGDFPGIVQKLDYISEMGYNTVWLNPFMKSPFKDGGYDVSDYYSVDPRFGTMEDFENFMVEAAKRNIRVIIDLVIGHTSDEHPWFKESQKAERNRYSDYYIWTDSCFVSDSKVKTLNGITERDGGYAVNFFATQPALNYGFEETTESYHIPAGDARLEPLKREIINIMKFWLDKGVAGFRVDLASSLIKNRTTGEALFSLWKYFIGTIRTQYPDCAFIAEWCNPGVAVGQSFFDCDFLLHECDEYNDLFRNEKGMNISPVYEKGYNYFSHNGQGNLDNFLKYTDELFLKLKDKGYFSVPSGNHDLIRLSKGKSFEELKVIFAFLLTFKHVPQIYYGDEIGLSYAENLPSKDGGYVRTGSRTPMQWDNSGNRGFGTGKDLYLPVNQNPEESVASQKGKNGSLLETVRTLCMLRKEHKALNAESGYEVVYKGERGYPLVYRRFNDAESILVALNPGEKEQKLPFEIAGELLFSLNYNGSKQNLGSSSVVIVKEK